ncbi:MAG: hypothetical protein PF569_09195 [Candidatus Woesearchaeota archaeon]|jgi:hypothetical protein|nr:hypothetical protein [Candidatus Woesearchaeota archaeon]
MEITNERLCKMIHYSLLQGDMNTAVDILEDYISDRISEIPVSEDKEDSAVVTYNFNDFKIPPINSNSFLENMPLVFVRFLDENNIYDIYKNRYNPKFNLYSTIKIEDYISQGFQWDENIWIDLDSKWLKLVEENKKPIMED